MKDSLQPIEIEQEFFDFLTNSPNEILESIIKNEITNLMKLRRAKLTDDSESDLMNKLYRPTHTGKPGEQRELEEVLLGDINGCIGITSELAGELADHAYYRLQKNIPKDEGLENWFNDRAVGFMGIPYKSILIFGIIKYSERLVHGNNEHYKDIEHKALQRYLDTQPQLTSLWKINS